jgi:tetratricopeptide (TPR) repeat protein
MSYLILDTDKHSTHSLRVQLSGISLLSSTEAADVSGLASYRKRNKVPPETIFLDLDGDPNRTLSSGPLDDPTLKSDRHLVKPIFMRNLRAAMIEGQARCQETRSALVFFGDRLFPELIREVGRSPKLWKQILEVETLQELVADKAELTHVGAIFIQPSKIDEKAIAAIRQVYKVTSASRISLVCLSNEPEEIQSLRMVCDYFVSKNQDWRVFLDHLAQTRLMKLAAALGIDQAKREMHVEAYGKALKTLDQVVEMAPLKTEALLLSAECSFHKKSYEEAEKKYHSVLSLNPCLPKPYARLLQIKTGEARQQIREQAGRYCPDVKLMDSGDV